MVSSEDLLMALMKMWIIMTLKESGLSITGIRIFLFYGRGNIDISENDTVDVCVWNGRRKETLVFANQDGNIRIHHMMNLKAFHPAKED